MQLSQRLKQLSQHDQYIFSVPVGYINSLMSTDLEQKKLEGSNNKWYKYLR